MTEPQLDFVDEDRGLWQRAFAILKRRGEVPTDASHPVGAIAKGTTASPLLHFTIARFKDCQLENLVQSAQPPRATPGSMFHDLNIEAAGQARAARLVLTRAHAELLRVQKWLSAATEHGDSAREAIASVIAETERQTDAPFSSFFGEHAIFRTLGKLQEAQLAMATAILELAPLAREALPRDPFPSMQGLRSRERKAEINRQMARLAEAQVPLDDLAEIFDVGGGSVEHRRDAVGDRIARGKQQLIELGEWGEGAVGDDR